MILLPLTVSLLVAVVPTMGYDNSRNDNLVAYYGQNSYGATHSDTANWQQRLSFYCNDDNINVFPLAFMNVFFSVGGLPEINLANTCSSNSGVFSGTNLANCQFLASDIQACQARGKIVTLSLGGASGAATFSSDAQAQTFATTVWNLFLGGSSSTRPFGNAVLDGIDLDIEGGGSTGFVAFVNKIRSLASGASKKYYITAAPQCPFPDAWLSPVINAVGFDAIYVQFYNNFCGVGSGSAFNFATWDNWAKTTSPNKNVKIYIGAPASSTAGSGFVDASTLGKLAVSTRSQFPSTFGGVMLWDVSQAYANGRFDAAIKRAIASGGGGGGTTTTPTSTTSRPTTTATTTTAGGASGSCAIVGDWVSNIAYVGGSQVRFNNHLWTAKWWTQADVPGGAAGVWTDEGACLSKVAATGAHSQISTAASVKTTAAAHITSAAASKASVSLKASGNTSSASTFKLRGTATSTKVQ